MGPKHSLGAASHSACSRSAESGRSGVPPVAISNQQQAPPSPLTANDVEVGEEGVGMGPLHVVKGQRQRHQLGWAERGGWWGRRQKDGLELGNVYKGGRGEHHDMAA